jgi:GNAT superfamily N-acetyltransferase
VLWLTRMELRVRLASEDDLDVLTSLVARANATYRQWASPDWEPPGIAHERLLWGERLGDAAAWNAVAVSSSVLGCVSFTDARLEEGRGRRIPGLAHLSRMFVDPEHWGRGIGSLLQRGHGASAAALRRDFRSARPPGQDPPPPGHQEQIRDHRGTTGRPRGTFPDHL